MQRTLGMGKNQANLSGPIVEQSKHQVKTRQLQILVPTLRPNGGSSLLLDWRHPIYKGGAEVVCVRGLLWLYPPQRSAC